MHVYLIHDSKLLVLVEVARLRSDNAVIGGLKRIQALTTITGRPQTDFAVATSTLTM